MVNLETSLYRCKKFEQTLKIKQLEEFFHSFSYIFNNYACKI